MKNFKLDTTSHAAIERIIRNVANSNDIADVISVNINMTREASIIHFEREKEAGKNSSAGDLLVYLAAGAIVGTAALAFKAVHSLFGDPELKTVIENYIKELATDPNSGVRAIDINEWTDALLEAIDAGTQEIAQDMASKSKATTPTATPTSAVKTSAIANLPMIKFSSAFDDDRIAMKGVGGRILDWSKNKAKNFGTSIVNLFKGANAEELADQIANLASRKGYLAIENVPRLKEIIKESVEMGLKNLQNQLAQADGTATTTSTPPSTSATATAPVPATTAPASAIAAPVAVPVAAPVKAVTKKPETTATTVKRLLSDPNILSSFDILKAQFPEVPDKDIFETLIRLHIKHDKLSKVH